MSKKEAIDFFKKHGAFEELQLDDLQIEGVVKVLTDFAKTQQAADAAGAPAAAQKPKRSSTVRGAFQYFLKDELKRLRKSTNYQDYTTLVAMASDKWKEMSLSVKQQYKKYGAILQHDAEDDDESVPSSDAEDD